MSKEAALAILNGMGEGAAAPAPVNEAITTMGGDAPAGEKPEGNPTATPETPPQPEQTATPEFNEKLALAARKERELFKKQEAFKQERQTLDNTIQELREKIQSMEAREKRLQTNPLAALQEMGFDYEKLTEMQMSGQELTPQSVADIIDQRFEQAEKRRAEAEEKERQAREEKQKQQYEEQISAFKDTLKSTIKETAEENPLTNLFDPDAELVWNIVEAYYTQTGKTLDASEAVKLANTHYKKMYDQAHELLNKAKAPDAPKEPENPDDPDAGQFKQPEGTKTLTNDFNQGAGSYVAPKTQAERMKRAMAALGGGQ